MAVRTNPAASKRSVIGVAPLHLREHDNRIGPPRSTIPSSGKRMPLQEGGSGGSVVRVGNNRWKERLFLPCSGRPTARRCRHISTVGPPGWPINEFLLVKWNCSPSGSRMYHLRQLKQEHGPRQDGMDGERASAGEHVQLLGSVLFALDSHGVTKPK